MENITADTHTREREIKEKNVGGVRRKINEGQVKSKVKIARTISREMFCDFLRTYFTVREN
jgi:hypothetical protein